MNYYNHKTGVPMSWQQKLGAWLSLLRFDKPIGIELLLYPTLWGLCLAMVQKAALTGAPIDWSWLIVLVFILGAVIMRAAGCAINDYADRHFDGSVARTNNRPLADGRLHPNTAKISFVGLLSLAALLLLFLPKKVFFVAIIAAVLAASYPFFKRYTHLPQLVLAAAFGMAIIMADVAILGYVSADGMRLFLAYVCWTVAYDTQYALCDRQDDIKIGVKSTAILFYRLFGKRDIWVIVVLQSMFVALMFWVFWRYFGAYALGILLSLPLFFYQYKKVRTKDRWQCLSAFLHNAYVARLMFVWTLFCIFCTYA